MRKHKLPHLVAEIDGLIAGYAYAVPFRKRPAYRYTVKHSIYVHPGRLHMGVGRALLPALVEACAAAGFRQMIGYIDGANTTSLKLHEACGFVEVGRLPSVRLQVRALGRDRHAAAGSRRGRDDQAGALAGARACLTQR